jgi:hypothetical protein
LLAKGKAEEEEIKAMAEEMGDRLWHEQHKTGAARGNVVLNSEITAQDKAIATGDWAAEHSLATSYVDRMPQNGASIK